MDIEKIISSSEDDCKNIFKEIDDTALYNQEKVLKAFIKNRISACHFAGTSGYGYSDMGREVLSKLFADIFRAQSAIISPYFASGTHAISAALFGVLRPGNTLLSISGDPYDTLMPVISGEGIGSLKEFGIKYEKVSLNSDGSFNLAAIDIALKSGHDLIFIQRSGGYNWRSAFSIADLKEIIEYIRKKSSVPIMIDNCYGEFVEMQEPLEIGANIIAGSLIKNPGGGLAPTGGYVAGDLHLIKLIEGRITAPGIGGEIGSYSYGYQYFYQGIFMAPHIVAQAMKAATLFGRVYQKLGYDTLPSVLCKGNDIIRSIKFCSKEKLLNFCKTIQTFSPVDSFAVPEPWDMPGYSHQVVMAAGTFVQGASIELSADSPIVAPYIGYLQGGLTYEHAKIVLKECLKCEKQ